jgi:hypothetical protein
MWTISSIWYEEPLLKFAQAFYIHRVFWIYTKFNLKRKLRKMILIITSLHRNIIKIAVRRNVYCVVVWAVMSFRTMPVLRIYVYTFKLEVWLNAVRLYSIRRFQGRWIIRSMAGSGSYKSMLSISQPRLRLAHLDPDGGRGTCIWKVGVHEHGLHSFLTKKSTMWIIAALKIWKLTIMNPRNYCSMYYRTNCLQHSLLSGEHLRFPFRKCRIKFSASGTGKGISLFSSFPPERF